MLKKGQVENDNNLDIDDDDSAASVNSCLDDADSELRPRETNIDSFQTTSYPTPTVRSIPPLPPLRSTGVLSSPALRPFSTFTSASVGVGDIGT